MTSPITPQNFPPQRPQSPKEKVTNKGCRTGLLISLLVVVVLGLGILALVLVLSQARSGAWTISSRGSIAIVDVTDAIMDVSEQLRQINSYSNNDSVKAIVVRINSPGGAVAPSQELYEELKKARMRGKKIVVSMGSVAASGGYYIACAADEIYANPGTITGSIGVIAQFPVIDGLMDKVGIKFETIKSGKYKDTGSFFRPMTEDEHELFEDMLMDVYDQFVEAVAEGRGMPIKDVRKYSDGRVFSGRQALEYGFVDALGTQSDAIERAGVLAGIKGKPRVIKKSRKRFLLGGYAEEMMNRFLPAVRPTYVPVLYMLR
jgi:protease-4